MLHRWRDGAWGMSEVAWIMHTVTLVTLIQLLLLLLLLPLVIFHRCVGGVCQDWAGSAFRVACCGRVSDACRLVQGSGCCSLCGYNMTNEEWRLSGNL